MGSADQAHVDILRLAAQRYHPALFQHPQQAGLQGQRHVADLVEEQGAAVSLLQLAAHALLARAGEAAAAITEQFALDQGFRDRRAVQRDERLFRARAGQVHGLGEGLLAGTGLAVEQQRHVARVDLQRPAEIGGQLGVAQAQAGRGRRRLRCRGHRQGLGYRPRRAAQHGVQGPSLAGAQRPAGAGLLRGATEQVVETAIEEGLHRLAEQALARTTEQVQRALVHRADPPVFLEGQQPFAEQADIVALDMEAQQPGALEATEEIAALDDLRRQVDQRHGVELALPRDFLARRRHVEHRHQLALRIEHRARRAGQAGVAATEVLFLLDGQGLPLDHAGADAVGAFAGLAPVGAEPEAGVFEGLALGVGVDAIEDHPAGIGEQYRVVVAGKLLVEAVHLAIGDLQHLLQALAAFEHARVLQHHRRHRLAGIEMVLFQAAQPGAGDGRIGRRAARRDLALGDGQHLPRVAAHGTGRHCYGSPRGTGRLLPGRGGSVRDSPDGYRCSIQQAGAQCNDGLTDESCAAPKTVQSVTHERPARVTGSVRKLPCETSRTLYSGPFATLARPLLQAYDKRDSASSPNKHKSQEIPSCVTPIPVAKAPSFPSRPATATTSAASSCLRSRASTSPTPRR
ncbi:hypothetical protein PA99_4379 [Pseudomonas aeruginosa PA99]|nr:hypothetical protein PA99_4379 [Pseudomonas aeruginosa PA99]